MDHSKHKTAFKALFGASLLFVFPASLLAQSSQDDPLAVLDELSDVTLDEQAGIALAGELAKDGKYLEALSALERVLIAFPKSHNARILHAVFLCDIDDKQGGLVELSQIKKKDVGEEAMNAALARCGAEAE